MSESTTTMDDHIKPTSGAIGPSRARSRHLGGGRVLMHALCIFLLMAAIAMAVAPVSGYKKGWAKYSRSNYLPPQEYGIPVPIKLDIWTGWIKGSDSIRSVLHAAAPARFPEYVYVKDVQHGGLVASGFTMAFLLLSALIGFLYLLAMLVFMCLRRPTQPYPPGLVITGIIVGIFNCLWSIACYIVLAIGIAIQTRRDLNGVTFVAWPDWCFFLAFFSGVFWLLLAVIAMSARSKALRSGNHQPAYMNDNAAYGSDKAPGFNGMSGAKPATV